MYDYLFITHLPAFYKVNLYNRLARRLKIGVVFVGSSSSQRTADFVGRQMEFDHWTLHDGDFESRPQRRTVLRLLALLPRLSYRRVVVGGWDLAEFWAALALHRRERLCMTLESTITESATSGVRSLAKRVFLSRVSTVFASGALHRTLLEALGYRGECRLTGGVGIFNRGEGGAAPRGGSGSFLYVGRLSPEKNLSMLVAAFNRMPQRRLTIVGSGPLEGELRGMARENVRFLPHVPNEEIAAVYRSHDVLVLPSLSEPWGLVVEEALYHGLPVLASDRVGCHTELIEEDRTGFIFPPDDPEALRDAVTRACEPQVYQRLREQVRGIDFAARDERQVASYLYGEPHGI